MLQKCSGVNANKEMLDLILLLMVIHYMIHYDTPHFCLTGYLPILTYQPALSITQKL